MQTDKTPFCAFFLNENSIMVKRNPIARRKAKIVCNFGLPECNRVNFGIFTVLGTHLAIVMLIMADFHCLSVLPIMIKINP